MARWIIGLMSFALVVPGAAAPARAQYRPGNYSISDPATGETYHVEARFGLWNPSPDIFVESESLGIVGDRINGVADLGFAQSRFAEIHVVLRPARKHKFRFDYIPIKYTAETVLKRRIVFNGQAYDIGLPVNSSLTWRAYRFGYEWDAFYRDRGFVGLILDLKYTDAEVDLNSPAIHEYARAQAPIPAIGGIGRVYVVPNISVTGEFTYFKLPEGIDKRYKGRYVDFDLYGTVNFNDYVGAQLGFRRSNVSYTIKNDSGAFKLKGVYFSGVVRF